MTGSAWLPNGRISDLGHALCLASRALKRDMVPMAALLYSVCFMRAEPAVEYTALIWAEHGEDR